MARIRTVKPEFFRHFGLYTAEIETKFPLRIAFEGLWTCADREGRFKWEPQSLKLDCLPYDDVDFSRVLHALTTRGFILRYTVDGHEYGAIPSFTRHQVINNRESPSSIPAPPEGIEQQQELTRDPRVDDACPTRHDLAQGEGKGREGNMEGKGKEPERAVARAPATRLPDDWLPGEPLTRWCETECPGFDWQRETEIFRDYWKAAPGAKGRKQDWPAVWRNWMRRDRCSGHVSKRTGDASWT